MAGMCFTSPLAVFASREPMQALTFFHTHTGEQLQINHVPGILSVANQAKINTFLRDFRTGAIHPIDSGLLDIISAVKTRTHNDGIIEVISGYRSAETNQLLQGNSTGVAKKSLHMKGQAIDIRIRNLSTCNLRDVAANLRSGGVGYYAKSDFVHLDTGRSRTW
ncbi:MAG: hypothetical protein BA874_02255 [Desulfuromonadales bacterium C00003068]|jgi:uncharacterized protein YcbK (DUF882 family)|nr:MAG: hypothetical protein BA874_02255 [Desulfuromonadales bacterium C00003068]